MTQRDPVATARQIGAELAIGAVQRDLDRVLPHDGFAAIRRAGLQRCTCQAASAAAAAISSR
jgi:hypothetical protein